VTRVAAGAAKDQLFKSPCCALLWLLGRGSGACTTFVLLGADVGFTMLRGLGWRTISISRGLCGRVATLGLEC